MFSDLSDSLVSLALQVLSFLPQSPFRPFIETFNDSQIHLFLCYANWVLPIGRMITILTVWLTAVASYYVYQIILRWIKVIN